MNAQEEGGTWFQPHSFRVCLNDAVVRSVSSLEPTNTWLPPKPETACEKHRTAFSRCRRLFGSASWYHSSVAFGAWTDSTSWSCPVLQWYQLTWSKSFESCRYATDCFNSVPCLVLFTGYFTQVPDLPVPEESFPKNLTLPKLWKRSLKASVRAENHLRLASV